jgi:hypothetical protein
LIKDPEIDDIEARLVLFEEAKEKEGAILFAVQKWKQVGAVEEHDKSPLSKTVELQGYQD